MSSFGEILRTLREEKALKQEDIAILLGISRGAISKYENNEREPDIKVINELTNHFGVTVDYLFGRTNIRSTPDYIAGNIKLIIGTMGIDEFVKKLKKEMGLEIEPKDMENYISGYTVPSFGVLQALADHAKVGTDFFYRKNTKEDLEKERLSRQEDELDDPDKSKIEAIMKNRAFIRLAAKIAENDLDIEIVEKLIDNALLIKRNHN